jgi:hypothetical protein
MQRASVSRTANLTNLNFKYQTGIFLPWRSKQKKGPNQALLNGRRHIAAETPKAYVSQMSDRLKSEIATFEKMRSDLEQHHKGKHVLIKGADLIGSFDSFNAAATEGLRLYPNDDFLVRQIGSRSPSLSPAILYGLVNADSENRMRVTGPQSEDFAL